MQASSLCRCICGTSKKDLVDATGRSLGTLDLDGLEEVDEPPFHPPPLVSGRLAYSVVADQPLRGAPIREGELWYLSAEEKVEPVKVSLHVNGFSFVHGEKEVRVSLSPFALVRNCKFQSSYCNVNLADIKIFKVSLFTQNLCYYYGVRGEDEQWAEEERSRWVLDISRVIRLVTQSLFPPFTITCDPISSVASTHRRLMAGYLVHHDDAAVASVLYCELHPHHEDQARLVLYENELCQVTVHNIAFTDCSMCSEKVGINCSCFCIEDHQFSTRTLPERKLWLRAISNVKVKLQNRAPMPTYDDLRHYRSSIKEYIGTIKPQLEGHAPMDALLQRSLRNQRKSRSSGDRGQADDSRGLGSLPPPPGPLAVAAEEAVAETSRAAAEEAAGRAKEAEAQDGGAEKLAEEAKRAELAGEIQSLEVSLVTPPRRPQAPWGLSPDSSTVPANYTPDSWSAPHSGRSSGKSGRSSKSSRQRSPQALHFGRIMPQPQELPQPGDG